MIVRAIQKGGEVGMTDREKVIKGLECCLGVHDCDLEPKEDCPYNGMLLCAMALEFDVVDLLKEQEPATPLITGHGEFETEGSWWYECGICGTPIDPDDKFCRKCGKAVKWNGID